eukprot:334078-Pyramimonas_sp.AAC.1
MMCTQEYALRHAAYKQPPAPREMKQYKQQVEDRMLKLAELLVQGKKAGTYMAAQEHELSVMKWMHWQLKPVA